jgi:hypothetical protein
MSHSRLLFAALVTLSFAAAAAGFRTVSPPDEAVQLASGKLLVAGGSKKVEVFDPACGTFLVAAGELSEPWHFMTETKLGNGSVLMTGGYANNDQSTSQAWIYRP